MGDTAIAANKLWFGNPLVVLGVQICLHDHSIHYLIVYFALRTLSVTLYCTGAVFWPAPDKVAGWLVRIGRALATGQLCGGEASKLAGALMWAAQFLFRHVALVCFT